MKKSEEFNLWLDRFLEEKKLPNKEFDIQIGEFTHYINSTQVIDLIRDSSEKEQDRIKDIIVKIDFSNGDVNHFLKHLAIGYIELNF